MKSLDDHISARIFSVKNAQGNRTRIKIVKAAVEFIYEEGIEYLTFESVGKKIGLNAGQVRYHFTEKSTLVNCTIDYVLINYQESIIKVLEKKKGWKSQIKAIIEGSFDWAKKHPEQGTVFLLFYYAASMNPRHRETNAKMFEMGRKRMVEILAQIDKFKNLTHLDSIALSIWAVVDGYLFYCIAMNDGKNNLKFRRLAIEAVERLLQIKF